MKKVAEIALLYHLNSLPQGARYYTDFELLVTALCCVGYGGDCCYSNYRAQNACPLGWWYFWSLAPLLHDNHLGGVCRRGHFVSIYWKAGNLLGGCRIQGWLDKVHEQLLLGEKYVLFAVRERDPERVWTGTSTRNNLLPMDTVSLLADGSWVLFAKFGVAHFQQQSWRRFRQHSGSRRATV